MDKTSAVNILNYLYDVLDGMEYFINDPIKDELKDVEKWIRESK